jgi:hypothetical protein
MFCMSGLLPIGVSSVALLLLFVACSSSVQVAGSGDGGASIGTASTGGATIATAGSTSVVSTGTGSSTSASSAGTGGAGGSTGCPPALPSTGQECSPIGLACEYGSDPRVQCRSVVQCLGMNGAGVWLANMMQPCPPIPPGVCPPEPAGTTLPCSPQGLLCTYPSGALCECQCPEEPCPSHDPSWYCSQGPAAGCPALAPNTGQPCSTEGLDCSYGNCGGTPTAIQRNCAGGTWQNQPISCGG